MAENVKANDAWLGTIPTSWGLKKINALYILRNQKVNDIDYQPLSVTKQGVLPQLETAAKTNDHNNRKLVKKGDFAINSRSDRRGSCGISEYDGSVSLINTVIKPLNVVDNRYYSWLFHTDQFADEFYKWGHGIVDDLWTTTWDDMKNINLPVPSIQEQSRIADFLDSKCAEIDSLFADIQKQIDTLEEYKKSVINEAVTKGLDPDVEMKDSGVEWIGAIPRAWDVTRIKYLGNYRNGLTYQPKDMCDENQGTLVLRSSNIQNSKLCFADNVYVKSVVPEKLLVKRDDILICSRNGSANLVGKNALIDTDSRMTFGAFMMIFKPYINPKYAYYVLNSSVLQAYLALFRTTTINQLTGSVFGNLKFPVTYNLTEQCEIVAYLDSKCAEIDAAIDLKKKQLNTLDDYKKSLIYEYVTGKKEVPNE